MPCFSEADCSYLHCDSQNIIRMERFLVVINQKSKRSVFDRYRSIYVRFGVGPTYLSASVSLSVREIA